MSWKTITENDVLTRISGPELAALRSAALGAGQADPLDDVMEQVTALVRGSVAAQTRVTMGPVSTIPESLLGPALDILVVEIMNRAAGTMIDPDDERSRKADRAYRLLERVADGKFAVESISGTGNQSGAGVTRPQHNPPRVSRQNMKGL